MLVTLFVLPGCQNDSPIVSADFVRTSSGACSFIVAAAKTLNSLHPAHRMCTTTSPSIHSVVTSRPTIANRPSYLLSAFFLRLRFGLSHRRNRDWKVGGDVPELHGVDTDSLPFPSPSPVSPPHYCSAHVLPIAFHIPLSPHRLIPKVQKLEGTKCTWST